MRSILFYLLIIVLPQQLLSAKDGKGEADDDDEAPTGVREPNRCEVCKFLAVELQGRLDETGKVRGFIETGHGLDARQKKRKEYKKSELRLIEALQEPHVCDKILQYKVHAERKKSQRYAKGESETMKTLKGLVDKGVKVDLGIPYELWDTPSAEISNMQRSCFSLVEDWEDTIEQWYWGEQRQPLIDYLCRHRVLMGKDKACLDEELLPPQTDDDTEDTAGRGKRKGDPGLPSTAKPPTPTTPHNTVDPIQAPPTEVKDEL